MGDFGYDIKMLSVVVDNEKSKTIPERGLYKTNVECSNGTTGEWDYNAWNLTLENVSESAKCSITFTSNLTEAEYNTYIDAGVSLRRNTYRGKDITSYLTSEGELNLYTQISSGRFNDIYVGDYINANNVTWLVADIDNYLYSGASNFTKHHLTMIPLNRLTTASMNSTATTEGGYLGSEMVTATLPSVYSTYIEPVFGEHVLTYNIALSNSVDPEITNSHHSLFKGVSNGNETVARKLDLMNQVNVFGIQMVAGTYFDVSIDHRQYAIFKLRPEYITPTPRYDFWLRDVASTNSFAYSSYTHVASHINASKVLGVRPRFLIG